MSRPTRVPDWIDLDQVADTFIDWRWDDKAACATVAGVNFFPERGESTKQAKAICRDCQVRLECLAEALTRSDWGDHGIWGMTSGDERRAIRVALRPARKAAA